MNSPSKHRSPLSHSPLWLSCCLGGLVACLIAFPKGGIKVYDIPVTWSYFYVGFGALLPVLFTFLSGKVVLNSIRFVSLLALIPIQTLILFSLKTEGYDDFGNAVALVVNWFVLPILLIVVWGVLFDAYPVDTLFLALRIVLPCIAFYGLVLFIYRQVTGDFFQIPYLTVNVDDMETLSEKHNMRGDTSKLIATYNNGNIYGVCTLMLYPLYRTLEKRLIPQWIILMALILTLSRTVWIGIILCELFQLLWVQKTNWQMAIKRLAFLLLPAGLGFGVFVFMGYDLGFVLDPNLGGRIPQFDVIGKIRLIRFESFDVIQEIVYLSVLNLYGALGLFFWILGLLSCIVLYYLGRLNARIPETKKAIILGLLVYMVLSGSDGAFLLIPTMAIFWLLSSLLLSPYGATRRLPPL